MHDAGLDWARWVPSQLRVIIYFDEVCVSNGIKRGRGPSHTAHLFLVYVLIVELSWKC